MGCVMNIDSFILIRHWIDNKKNIQYNLLLLKNVPQNTLSIFFRIEISLHFGVPDNQSSLS